MTPERARTIWMGYWRAMRRWHRYRVEGVDRLLAPGPALIVGYHGRPIAHDLCMLQTLLWDEHRVLPRAVMHATAAEVPFLREVTLGMEFVTGDGESMARAVAEGAKIIVTPGGTREGCRSVRDRYRVEWGRRTGYLKLAIRYGLPILPTAARGVDDVYVGLNNGYEWGKRLGVKGGVPVWLGVGPFGLWPFSLPFPVRVTTRVGEPIDLRHLDPADPEALAAGHRTVVGAVQRLLDTPGG